MISFNDFKKYKKAYTSNCLSVSFKKNTRSDTAYRILDDLRNQNGDIVLFTAFCIEYVAMNMDNIDPVERLTNNID